MLQMIFRPAALLRKRVALVLGAVLLAGFAPPFTPSAKADLYASLTITSGSATYTDSNVDIGLTGGSFNFNTGEGHSGTFFSQGFYVSIQGNAGESGTTGRVVSENVTVTAVNGSTATVGTITVTLTVSGYTQPTFPQGTLSNSISTQDFSPDSYTASLTGAVLNSSGGTEGSNTPASISAPMNPGGISAGATSFFQLTDPYQLQQTTTFSNVVLQGGLGESATVDETTQVTGSAPGALVMALTAFPVLLGMAWARRRKLSLA
jgi:hypothetical protein